MARAKVKTIFIDEKSARIAKRICAGEFIKYDAAIHPQLLINVYSRGDDKCHFLSEAEIGPACFTDWLAAHPEFNAAYQQAKQLAFQVWMNKLPLDLASEEGERFNYKLWLIIMRNRFGYTDQRKLELQNFGKAKTHQARMDALVEAIGAGEVTGQETQQLSSVILAGVKVDEHTTVLQRIDKLEGKYES